MDADQIARVASFVEELPVGIWVAKAPGGEFVYANRAFAEIMGMRARSDVAVGEYAEPYGIYHRDGHLYPEEQMPFVRALRAKQTVVVDDLSIHRGDGTRIAVRATARPLLDANGEVALVLIAFYDVTAEATAEQARAEAQRRLESVIEHTPLILFAYDRDYRITLSEGRGLASLGLKSGEVVGRTIAELYASEPDILANCRRALEGEEFIAQNTVGGATFQTHYTPVRDAAGTVTGVTAVAMDITDRERIQAKLLEADRMATLGTIAASVAHEVNTPLSYVATSLERIGAELGQLAGRHDLTTVNHLLYEARQGIERVKRIARDLNTFSRPQLERAPVDLGAVLSAAVRMTSHHTQAHARLELRLAAVPPVLGNESELAQVFLNLLVNAAQALPPGPPGRNEIRIVLRAETGPATEQVIAEVRDNGPGLDPAIGSRIFEPFFTTKPSGVGTGLGLSICRRLIESHGGTIEVERADGWTIFRVKLPATQTRVQPSPAAPPRPQAQPGQARVLVIDDDPSLIRVLKIALPREYAADLVTDGEAAVEKLLGPTHYDVILCDLMMPRMTGMKLYERVRRERPGLERRICFMTGGAFTDEAREFLARIPNRCLEKPFNFAEAIAGLLAER